MGLVSFSHPRLLIHHALHLGVVLLMDPGGGFHEQVFIMSMSIVCESVVRVQYSGLCDENYIKPSPSFLFK